MKTCQNFFRQQLDAWPEARARFEALATQVERRTLDGGLVLQYNPARIVSTGAKIPGHGQPLSRPCFLCAAQRPAEQQSLPSAAGEILVNPFPILAPHFTIVHRQHVPQSLAPFIPHLYALCLDFGADHVVFYNGPTCGASAPDHAHLQAGGADGIPLLRLTEEEIRALPYRVVRQTVHSSAEADAFLRRATRDGDDFNLLATASEEGVDFFLIPRRRHRPAAYFLDGDAQRLVSPGALDMAGLVITPRRDDFLRLTSQEVLDILTECGVPNA